MKRTLILPVLLAVLAAACSGGGETTSSPAAAAPATAAAEATGGGAGYKVVDPAGLQKMMDEGDVYLINVHVPYEGELPGTDAFIPYTEIAQRLDEIPFGKQPVVIYCRSGNMSTEAAQAMVQAGAPEFYELGGGWYAWQAAGLPLKTS